MKNNNHYNILWLLVLSAAGILWFVFRLQHGSILVPGIPEIFTYVVFAPVAEELFFRGVLQDAFRLRFAKEFFGISVANLCTALMFVAVHIPFWGVSHALLVFFPSLAFGFIYDKTGKMTYAIFLHALYNFNIFIV